ncbi:hypothetical protein CY652_19120 [Burkholderia sp. WAC0059]|nr:hypothetical protein CY652_19120 [Burkholderia sp. WAC0059]
MMDSRVVAIAVVLFVVLVVLLIALRYVRKWFDAHPNWKIVAAVGMVVACFLVIAAKPQFSDFLDCLPVHSLACIVPIPR